MVRTQIYLTQKEKEALTVMSVASGKKRSQLIREAVDQFLLNSQPANQDDVCNRVCGMWADRDDTLTAESLRNSWERE